VEGAAATAPRKLSTAWIRMRLSGLPHAGAGRCAHGTIVPTDPLMATANLALIAISPTIVRAVG